MRGAPATGVSEAHILEADGGRERLAGLSDVLARLDHGLRVQHREYALCRRQTHHALMQQRAQIPLRSIDLDAHHEDDEQRFEAHGTGAHPVCAVSEGRSGADRETGVDDTAREGIRRKHPHRAFEKLVSLPGQ